MNDLFLETERMSLYKMDFNDFDEISKILKNPEIMYAWEYNFSDKDVFKWIEKSISNYKNYNLGYFIAVDKTNGCVVGLMALMPDVIENKEYLEIGYILKKEYWGNGYAKEGALALLRYSFESLKVKQVIAEIRPMNINSIKVAESIGMSVTGDFIKNVRGKEMLHLIYSIII